MSQTETERQAVGELVAQLVEVCMQSNLKSTDAVFALGIAAAMVGTLDKSAALDERDKSAILRVLTVGLNQEVVAMRMKETSEDDAVPIDAKKH